MITKNNKKYLNEILSKVSKICDEIIIVDDGSIDKTEEICKKYNANFVYHKFEDFGKQRNFAISLCKNDYILTLDADKLI